MEKQYPLRDARQAKGLTLTALAASVKTDAGHLSRVERGESTASPALAEEIVNVVGGDLIHEMQILYPLRYVTRKKLKLNGAVPPLRVKVADFLYALIGPA